MKTVSALVLFSLVAVSSAQHGEEEIKKCLEQVGLTPDDVNADREVKKHTTKMVSETVTTEGSTMRHGNYQQCFFACLTRHYGLLDDEGKPSAEKIEEFMTDIKDEAERKRITDRLTKCKETVEASGATDLCEIGAAFLACSMKPAGDTKGPATT